jgi:branched-chain amino acid transport system permease protein
MTATTATSPLGKPRIQLSSYVERGAATLVVIGLVVWLVANFLDGPRYFLDILLVGLNQGAVYALIALGYTLVYGIIELINFAHGDLFMLGSIVAANLMVNVFHATTPSLANWLWMAVALVATMTFGASVNMGAEYFAYRRLRRAPKLAPLITAVGLSFIFQNVGQKTNCTFVSQWFTDRCNGSPPRQWPSVLSQKGFDVFGVNVPYTLFVVLGVTVPLLLLLTLIVQRTRYGKAMRAVAQDQDGARLMGINVDRTISMVFGLGGAMAGAASLLYLEAFGTTRYDAGFQLGLIAFTAAVLGGIGNLAGAVTGGILIGIIQAFNDGLPFGMGQKWSQTAVFTVLILLMVFKPEGIFGTRTTEKV